MFNAAYSRLSEEERRILEAYHDKVTQCQSKLLSGDNSMETKLSPRLGDPPAKVLPTYIFNDSETPRPIDIPSQRLRKEDLIKSSETLTQDSTSKSTSRSFRTQQRKVTPKRQAQVKTTPKSARPSSRKGVSNPSQVKPKKPARPQSAASSSAKPKPMFNISNIPNFKYEVEKLLRAVFRHSVNCPDMKEELRKIGGVKLLEEYIKCRHAANT
ncbi:unnamed protein product [Blepharisma stoltei]|uniref:Uncharacterized protein n=1 Tax=Blepharisma stoltei TaxID=1481888 RepID=A0AAU9K464_9CILI|nr:unnamed protein product [Blepharisma stoltei]